MRFVALLVALVFALLASTALAVKCPAGQYVDEAKNVCKQCPAGTFQPESNTGSTGCYPCEYRQFAAPGSAQCTDCPSSYLVGAGSVCRCQTDYYFYQASDKLCKPYCNAGTYFNSEACDGPACGLCTPCPAGSYSDGSQVTKKVCTKCSGNTITFKTGQSSCISCPAGSISNKDHTGCTQTNVAASADDEVFFSDSEVIYG